MTIQTAYNYWAKTYDTDANITRDLDAVITREVLANENGRFLLELGCGTGKNTVLFSQLAVSVLALDFSPEMLAQAREKVTANNVQFTQADLTQTWPSQNETVDLLICNLVLEHIKDLGFIFSEAARTLVVGGKFFISELHPFKQYLGSQANFTQAGEYTPIQAYIHHISDFLDDASHNGFRLVDLGEWWHENDEGKPPRLISFMFEKQG